MINFFRLCFYICARNWIVYKKNFISNISPTIADPAFTMIALGMGLGAYVSSVENMTYMDFLAPGLTISTALFTSFFESSYGFYVRMSYENVFKAMLTTPIGAAEIFGGEMLWVGVKGAIMSCGVAVVLSLLGYMHHQSLLPLMLLIGFFIALPCGALGLIATSWVSNINQFQTVYSFIIAPLYFLSGIFFPITQMNPTLKMLTNIFPLIHGVHMAQAVFWNQNILEVFCVHGSILLLQTFVLCGIAYWSIKKRLIA